MARSKSLTFQSRHDTFNLIHISNSRTCIRIMFAPASALRESYIVSFIVLIQNKIREDEGIGK